MITCYPSVWPWQLTNARDRGCRWRRGLCVRVSAVRRAVPGPVDNTRAHRRALPARLTRVSCAGLPARVRSPELSAQPHAPKAPTDVGLHEAPQVDLRVKQAKDLTT